MHVYKHTQTDTRTDYLLNIYSLLFTMMCFHILKWPVVPICVIGIYPGDQRRADASSRAANQRPERGEEGRSLREDGSAIKQRGAQFKSKTSLDASWVGRKHTLHTLDTHTLSQRVTAAEVSGAVISVSGQVEVEPRTDTPELCGVSGTFFGGKVNGERRRVFTFSLPDFLPSAARMEWFGLIGLSLL